MNTINLVSTIEWCVISEVSTWNSHFSLSFIPPYFMTLQVFFISLFRQFETSFSTVARSFFKKGPMPDSPPWLRLWSNPARIRVSSWTRHSLPEKLKNLSSMIICLQNAAQVNICWILNSEGEKKSHLVTLSWFLPSFFLFGQRIS